MAFGVEMSECCGIFVAHHPFLTDPCLVWFATRQLYVVSVKYETVEGVSKQIHFIIFIHYNAKVFISISPFPNKIAFRDTFSFN